MRSTKAGQLENERLRMQTRCEAQARAKRKRDNAKPQTMRAALSGAAQARQRAALIKGAAIKKSDVDPYVTDLLENIDHGKTILRLRKDATVFSQGDPAEAIYFIQTGKVKITVVSAVGKEAVLAMLGARGFLGEGCLVGQTLRLSTATAIQSSTLFRIERAAMLRALHAQPELSEKFTASLLARNIDLEEDLCDQLFNHSEKRLARVLLKLARFGQHDAMPAATMPRVSHETLAEMVGTTRSRITYFMNKFRTLGLIDYNGEITVRAELLTDVVLHD
jgi:CRP/FNR family transcriptional regulator, cyclic AMP receptor protein